MGTILASRFDFTSVDDMRKAYASAFAGAREIEWLAAEQQLTVLEASQNLIVHRGGVVEENFFYLCLKRWCMQLSARST